MQSPRTLAESVEHNPTLPSGPDERFAGYGVMGVPFSSGYILALRHFVASSVGPGYTSVWIREPAGSWTMHSTVNPASSCPRYFGSALQASSTGGIAIRWRDDCSFNVEVGDGVDLSWDVTLAATPVTRIMSAVAGAVPPAADVVYPRQQGTPAGKGPGAGCFAACPGPAGGLLDPATRHLHGGLVRVRALRSRHAPRRGALTLERLPRTDTARCPAAS